MARVQNDIQMKKSLINENQKETHKLHLSAPIVCDYSEYNSSTGIDSTSEEIDIQSDDDDEIEVAKGEHWNSIINEWIIMVQQENQFHDDDDEYMYSSELEVGFELGGRRVHPAEDNLMKWSLESLFIYELESPTFLGSDVIFTGAC
ncbi:1366_t:CDS:2 [Entrophospora sp. SA101]|nr:1366_t:CDS:2 [Entrophospora sp. SA101]